MSFFPLNQEDIQISSDSIVSTLWSNNSTTLNQIFKNSVNPNSYWNIYSQDITLYPDSEVQFSLSYGNRLGSGSAPINVLVPNVSPTRITYGQIRTLMNGDENTPISFGTGNSESEDIYVINLMIMLVVLI
jgi:hypothetical protein